MVFTDKQLENYAQVLIWGLKTARPKFKKYDTILLRCDLEGLRLGEIVYRKLVQFRYNPVFRAIQPPGMERDFYLYSDPVQRKFIAAGEREFCENLNGSIYVHAPSSLTHLKDIDTKKQSETAVARKFLRDIMEKTEAKGRFGWTLCTYPTEELARRAGLNLREYACQISRACFLDENDPVKKWGEVYKNTLEIKKWLKSLKIESFRVVSMSMDLVIKLGDRRRFLGVSGHNIPSFEIFTSPDWRGTSGVYYADLPTFRGGNYIEGIRLEFTNGRAVKISAKKGEDYAKKIMATDAGAAQIGEFSMTDRRFSRIDRFMADILFDENHGGKYGNCHLAVGAAYLDTFDGNASVLTHKMKKNLGFNESAIHWDLINTEKKTIKAKLKSGKEITVYENGMFKY